MGTLNQKMTRNEKETRRSPFFPKPAILLSAGPSSHPPHGSSLLLHHRAGALQVELQPHFAEVLHFHPLPVIEAHPYYT
jgi:hypothetical protein